MRILQLHVDYVEYNPINKEIKEAEDNILKRKTTELKIRLLF